jgi:pimeloyl-ACP methyl ester carboxylesterase
LPNGQVPPQAWLETLARRTLPPMASTLRFLRQYFRPAEGTVHHEDVSLDRGDRNLEATVYRPRGGPRPGWVVLHGLTARGRDHPNLIRFARALAASGTVVFIPDIPEWRRLEVAPQVTVETIRASVLALDAMPGVVQGRTGVLGFSFGATQALIASVDPELEGHLRGVAAWGGYCDVRALFRFGILGDHEWEGRPYHVDPDPYGRWVMGGNYLTGVPGHEGDIDAARALHVLAIEAGESGLPSWDARFDASKDRLRDSLPADQRAVFDLFAARTDAPPPDRDRVSSLADALATAALTADPGLDPTPHLSRVKVRTLLAHGHDDRLVPFTSMFCLRDQIPDRAIVRASITSLFSHSGGAAVSGPAIVTEGVRFLRLLDGILKLI